MTNVIKTDLSGYVKDTKTGVVINKNISELQAYKSQKEGFKKIKKIEDDLSSLKSDMQEIKEALLIFLQDRKP